MSVPPGTTYGDLTVIREIERSGYNRRFLCRCVCGAETVKFLNNLCAGRSRSCGCTYEYGVHGRTIVLAERRRRAQESDEGRVCHTCGLWQPWDRFGPDKRRSRGKSSNCTDCGRWRMIKSLYGITRAEYEWLRDSQQGKCVLCGQNGNVRLSVDHDHSCCPPGRACKKCIRGMLCAVCNLILGRVEARPLLASRFSDYLERRPFQ